MKKQERKSSGAPAETRPRLDQKEPAAWRSRSKALPRAAIVLAAAQLVLVVVLNLLANSMVQALLVGIVLISLGGCLLSGYLFGKGRVFANVFRTVAYVASLLPAVAVGLSFIPMLTGEYIALFTEFEWAVIFNMVQVGFATLALTPLLAAMTLFATNALSRKKFDLISLRIFSLIGLLGTLAMLAYPVKSGVIGSDTVGQGVFYTLGALACLCLVALIAVACVMRAPSNVETAVTELPPKKASKRA